MMTRVSKFAVCLFLSSFFLFTSCGKDEEMVTDPTIYERLGGSTMVADPDNPGQQIEAGRLSFRKVVNTTIGLIVADITAGAPGNLQAHFAPVLAETGATQTTNIAKLSDNLTDFFSFNTGGTNAVNTYSGLNMVDAHDPAKNSRMGTKSSNADYDKFVGFVGAAAQQNGVAANTQLYTDIVAVLESLRAPIVQK
ncbi:MAG: group 1 truncated hemoglobin [Saprospiraceae bacterium]|nr:group 1 truncated hemoglobin [Saprospiraceae bacterium]